MKKRSFLGLNPVETEVKIEPSINPVVVGGAVTLSLSPSVTLTSGTWAVGKSPILTWQEDQQAVFPSHSGRAVVNVTTGALTVTTLTEEDSGVYTVQSPDPQLRASASITIIEPISNVTLSVNQTNLTEFRSSAFLECSVSTGTFLSFLWMNGSSEVTTSDRVHLTEGNTTLIIVSVTRHDSGPFRCYVFNDVSDDLSEPVIFTLSYGPDNMALTVNGLNKTSFPAGSNLTLLCTADSSPPAQLQWASRGNLVNRTDTLLQLFSVTEHQSGSYSCLAFNNHTNTHNNITKHITILKSGSDQETLNASLIPLLFVAGFLLSLLGKKEEKRSRSQHFYVYTFWFPPKKKQKRKMKSPVAFVLILTVITFTDHVCSQRLSEKSVPVGSNETLLSEVNVTVGTWTFNGDIIVLIYPGGFILSKTWEGRIRFSPSMSSLTIMSLQTNDSGEYKLNHVDVLRVQVKLSVQVPISDVTLWANATDLVEFNNSVVLMCSVSNGSSLSYEWLRDNSTITARGDVQLSNGNATLTIAGVTRHDKGSYRCNVSNGLGSEVSPAVHLSISYGPSNTTMMIMPMMYMHKTGTNITLSCSTQSQPPATVQWMVDGVNLNQTSSTLQLENVTQNNSGNYKCVFHNTVTSRFAMATTVVRIMDPITAVVVNPTVGPAILHEAFTLRCTVTGPFDNIQWWKNGELISADNTTVFDMNNMTLTLNPVQHSDGGSYQCWASNLVSNMTSTSYEVEVNYGPEKIAIMGPNVVKTGDNVTFRCSVASHPPSNFKWSFNGSVVSNMSEYATPPLTKDMSGKYTCMAFNNVTNRNSSADIMLSVIDPIEDVQIDAQMNPVMEGYAYNLTCNVTGPADHVSWMKDGEYLQMDNRTLFYMDNKTLMFMPLKRHDTGNYHCMAINAVGNMTSPPFNLLVNYGPENLAIMGPTAVKTGDNVTLRCWAASYPPSFFKWSFNGSVVSNMSEYATPPLTKDMSGKYTCMAFNNVTNKNSTTYIMLSVVDPIEGVKIEAQMNPAIEGDSYNLTCNVTGPADHVYWMKDGEYLKMDNRTLFYMDNKTVMFMPLNRHHAGNYHCMAINAVGNMTSPPYMFLVNYGPENVYIMGPNAVKTGGNVTLSCHATSAPPSLFQWSFNGSVVSNMSEYATPPLTKDMSGKYTCMAFNNVTNKNSTTYIMLSVVDPIEDVQIEMQMNPAIEGYAYNLTCNVTGPAVHVYWMKDGEHLKMDNRTLFYMNNKRVMFMPLKRHDAGNYHCMAINAVGNMTSPAYNVIVNFGPDTPIIAGLRYAETGRHAFFNCSAMSVPPSYYTWWFNGSNVANTSMFTAGPLSLNMSGQYTCMAHNNVTGMNSTNSIELTVVEAIESVMIQNRTMPINNENFTLICHVVGPYDMIDWMKDNMSLKMSSSSGSGQHKSYHAENNMLHFTPVTIDNDGTYQCVATNLAARHESQQYTLLVNYGPLMVTISGPDLEDASVSFTCSADSRPEPDFRWFFNNLSMPLTSGAVFKFAPIEAKEGNYICKATNPVTNVISYQSKEFAIGGHAAAVHYPAQGGLMLMSVFAFTVHLL
ncbi:hemicentin-1-like [Cololabis saira]|uniref:hemicentin-1-like n=1 Tax=Cololabis saira TaxID=129043 RepID=UPI002AD32E35|nr:hemicentin-1-like [Cololabis saira]